MHAGEHGITGTEIPCFRLTSLPKVWDLGLEAGWGRATSPLPSAATGLPVPPCLPNAGCSGPLPGCCLCRKTHTPSESSPLQTYCTATTISNALREIQYFIFFSAAFKTLPPVFLPPGLSRELSTCEEKENPSPAIPQNGSRKPSTKRINAEAHL